ncbi:hypothetical protein QAD02_006196 [Eretmocerus hayati]|uniref:Uncharacterized protein n=1 Tax=Eretmocerus hayati TaxID=131215 RepID=A0ACC2N2M4_9HYME|nr:hypothetical protein QAD02_006196 [Eretmocerus hayati]
MAQNQEEYRVSVTGTKLVINDYIYVRARPGENGKFYWNCRKTRHRECTARAITRQIRDEIRVIKGPREFAHSHPPDHEKAEAETVLNSLRRTAEEHPEIPPAQVLRSEINDVDPGVLARLPDRLYHCGYCE